MSRPKDPFRYPAFLRDLLEYLNEHPGAVREYPCTNRAEAKNLQLTFNCFKTAAINAGWSSPTRYPDLPVLTARIREVEGVFQVDIFNMELDPAVQRWSKLYGTVTHEPERLNEDREE